MLKKLGLIGFALLLGLGCVVMNIPVRADAVMSAMTQPETEQIRVMSQPEAEQIRVMSQPEAEQIRVMSQPETEQIRVMSQPEAEQIRKMAAEQQRRANIPCLTIAVMKGDTVEFLSSSDGSVPVADENALFQIGSVTKAFTALGILLLEDEGLISLDAPVSQYIPWFTVRYGGREIDADDLTIADLLYQTSGFTNDEAKYPRATGNMTLEENIRRISGSELSFYPAEQYAYANTNYYLLGYVIEVISGQRYEDFMLERIFMPLGLHHTYASPKDVKDREYLVEGSRLSFFRSRPYEIPVTQGNVPAGYIFTNAVDLSRWVQIQMGAVTVSEQFSRIIGKSHQANPGSVVNDHTQYACGWFVDEPAGQIYHSGGTPNFSAMAAFRPDEQIGVCVLTNINASANTVTVANNVLDILAGKPPAPYRNDVWTIFDSVFSVITVVCSIGIVVLLIMLLRLRRRIRGGGSHRGRGAGKPLAGLVFTALFVVAAACNLIFLPAAFGSGWLSLLEWCPPSMLMGCVLVLMSAMLLFVLQMGKYLIGKQESQ